MTGLSSDQALMLAEQMAGMDDVAGALARVAEILTAEPTHAGAQKLAASLQFRAGLVEGYRINLPKRTDRVEECRANEAQYFYPAEMTRLWKAVEDADFGAVGCGKSHIEGLTDFFVRSRAPYCMMLEDDFDFLRPASELAGALAAMQAAGLEWDVLLLAGTRAIPYEQPSEVPFLLRVLESQSTAGYIVNRHYVPKLLACLIDAVAQLERFRKLEARSLIYSRFAIDNMWKVLQRQDRWYIGNPTFGHQRAGFSDIEGKVENYSAITFYKWP